MTRSYHRVERRLAALLDAAPGLKRLAKAGYQRLNYLLHGGRDGTIRLHARAAIERIPGADGAEGAAHAGIPPPECFFGYFGIPPWSRDGRRSLFHQWRPGEDTIELCIRDPAERTSSVVARTAAWNFQQGSLAQWLPAEGGESVIFNDLADGRPFSRILAPDGRSRSLPSPIQAVHPQGGEALSLDYRRLEGVQPEYGYRLRDARPGADGALDGDGLWRLDLASGDARLLVSLAELAARSPRPEMRGARHAVNHAVYSPRGERIVFMHRWLGTQGLFSRLYVARADGSELRLLLDSRMVSHYAWRDEDRLLAYARAPESGDRYYVIDAASGARAAFCAGTLDRFGDGHPTYSPDGRWIVTDSYPDRARMRRLLLCHADGGEVTELGAFFAPWRYDGERRCDLHPRWDREGRRISIDSAHEGFRATYVVDVAGLQALF